MRAALLSLLLLATPLTAADDPATVAAQAASDLRQAVDALGKARGSRDRVAALTQTIGAYERGLSAFRQTLRAATIRESEVAAAFEAKRDRVGRVLAAMTAMQDTPGPLLLFHPDGPEAAVRSALVLAAVAPALQAEAEALKADLAEIAALRQLRAESAAVLQSGLEAAQAARTALSLAVQDRTDLPRRFLEDPEEIKALAASARTLDAFAAGISELESDIGPPTDDFAGARGRLTLPVFGRLLRRAGEADAAGIRRPGLVLATRPGALVTAPWTATIRYRGPLLDYGNVMILEPAAGYLMVLAGLGTVYGAVGDVVQAGAAVGLMPGEEHAGGELLALSQELGDADRRETLYVELRLDGAPADPTEWFAETRE